MNVLVLGGNGFIGSHVVDALSFAGHRVRIFDRAEDRYQGRRDGVEYVIGSFNDVLLLSDALTDIDVVFHSISTTVPSTSNSDPAFDIQSNLVATVQLLNAMLVRGVKRIVYLSSGGTVYGQSNSELIAESHPLRPISSYGVVKVAIENYLYMYQQLHGMQATILRPANPYGERQGNLGLQGVIGTFLCKLKRNEVIEIWGDGTVVRDFIYIGDLAEICRKSVEVDISGIFNVGGGRGYSINEVLRCIATVTGRDPRPVYKQGRGFDVRRVVLDISLAEETFGWRPRTTLEQGVRLTSDWLQSGI